MHRLSRRPPAAHQKEETHEAPSGIFTSTFSRRGLRLPSAASTPALLRRCSLLVWRKEEASAGSLTTYNPAVACSDLRAQSWSLPPLACVDFLPGDAPAACLGLRILCCACHPAVSAVPGLPLASESGHPLALLTMYTSADPGQPGSSSPLRLVRQGRGGDLLAMVSLLRAEQVLSPAS